MIVVVGIRKAVKLFDRRTVFPLPAAAALW
jgi:hypothetical protein